jgi:hypothetical protein
MLRCLAGMLVSGLVIFFPVVNGGSTVRVCDLFMKLGSSLVRVFWHSVSPLRVSHLVLGGNGGECRCQATSTMRPSAKQ